MRVECWVRTNVPAHPKGCCCRVYKGITSPRTPLTPPALNEILHHQPGVHKRRARWVPHQLTEEQKVGRVQWCLTMLEKYDSGRANSTWNIISGDETWVYQFDPETKVQSSVWLFPGDTQPLNFKRSRSTSKQMVASYIAQTRHITTIPLEERHTVTADWYVHQCLPNVL